MFQYTDTSPDKSLIVLINHDDCQREYKYNDDPEADDYENESLDAALDRDNWIVVSMKEDFETIFESNLLRKPPICN